MRRRLKNLKNKSGHSENGSPRALIDLATYYERRARNVAVFDSEYSGWSNPSRPRDQAISLRSIGTEPSPPPG